MAARRNHRLAAPLRCVTGTPFASHCECAAAAGGAVAALGATDARSDRYVLWYANSAIGNALNEVMVGLARRHTRRIVRIISPIDSSDGNPTRKHARKRALDEFAGMFLYALVRRAISTEFYRRSHFGALEA